MHARALAPIAVVVAGGEAVHHHQQEVPVGEQLGVRRAQPGPVVLVLGVERPLVEDRAERLLDPRRSTRSNTARNRSRLVPNIRTT